MEDFTKFYAKIHEAEKALERSLSDGQLRDLMLDNFDVDHEKAALIVQRFRAENYPDDDLEA